jgi:hypothetical protein
LQLYGKFEAKKFQDFERSQQKRLGNLSGGQSLANSKLVFDRGGYYHPDLKG